MDKKQIIKNCILFLIGFCTYITMEVLFRGYSYPLMGIAGGISLILIGGINNYISWEIPLFYQSIIGSSIVTFIELIIGLIDKFFLHIGMWDYSNIPLNFMGIICVPFSIAWIGISLIAIIVSDAFEYYVIHEKVRPYYKSIFGHILFILPERECKLE